MDRFHVSFAGSGRVGSALCRELSGTGYNIDLIVSETEKRGRRLADSCNAAWSSDLVFPGSTMVIIVAVPDNRLEEVLKKIKCSPDTLVVHTAGSYGIDLFPERIKRRGVLYPLQTFSADRKVNFRDLPFLIESTDNESEELLTNMILSLGGKILFADAGRRRILHLAAVFACNFTNHLMTHGRDLAIKAGFSFEILIPLITETFTKALEEGPENSQTGPALRNDVNTISKHLDLLTPHPDLQRIYNEMTKSIINYYKERHSG